MNSGKANISVLVGDRSACVRISGRATFTSSLDFKTLLTELLQKNYRLVVLDLAECALMDSTFLGVLAGFALRMKRGENGASPLELLNPNERILELLESLGVLDLFQVSTGQRPMPEECVVVPHEPGNYSRVENTQACLEAHEILIALRPENAARFKDVTQFLTEDLKRLKSAAP